jgi:hypothetical protein
MTSLEENIVIIWKSDVPYLVFLYPLHFKDPIKGRYGGRGGVTVTNLCFMLNTVKKYKASNSIKTMCQSYDVTINTGTMINILLILITR